MIKLRKVCKSYHQQDIFKDFSYTFNDTGFYLVFGPSGCGKTTLLNLLAQIIEADSGIIEHSDINGIIDNPSLISSQVAYITQDIFLISYLTIRDHFTMLNIDHSEMDNYLEIFNLSNQKDCFPSTLCIGEKQRVACIIAILQKKKILLIDEPTASLDKENAIRVFEILQDLKDDILIVCVSHDHKAKQYCDTVIDLSSELPKQYSLQETSQSLIYQANMHSHQDLNSVVSKQFKRGKQWNLSNVFFIAMLVISITFLFSSIRINEKVLKTLSNENKLNYIAIDVQKDRINQINQLPEGQLIKRIVMSTSNSIQSFILRTLPANEFLLMHKEFDQGSYFTKQNEIILGADFRFLSKFNSEIMRISDLSNQEIIGQQIYIDTSFGTELMTIVGIFKPFSLDSENYFYQIGNAEQLDATIYVNDLYVNNYINDDAFVCKQNHGKCKTLLFFEDSKSLNQFIKLNHNKLNYDDPQSIYVPTITENHEMLITQEYRILMTTIPFLVISSITTILFFIHSNLLVIKYQIRNMVGLSYFGYTKKQITKAYAFVYIKRSIKLVLIASLIATTLIIPINLLIKILGILEFPLLAFGLLETFIYLLFVLPLLTILMYVNIRKIKIQEWYQIIREKRDLL